MASEKILKLGIRKEVGYNYFIDKEGNVVRLSRDGKEQELVAETSIEKEPGYVYFIDSDGDISRFKMGKE